MRKPFYRRLRNCSLLNSLAITHPELVTQWHPTKNGTLTPDQVTAGSSRKAWWRCLEGPDHEWETRIAHRANGNKCPFCRGLQASILNSLATLQPEIAAQWHPTKNGVLTPNLVVPGSEKKFGGSVRSIPCMSDELGLIREREAVGIPSVVDGKYQPRIHSQRSTLK
jgi:Probable Zinc-ribbon domain